MTGLWDHIKTLVLFILIAGFTIVLYFKNSEIESLRSKILELPKIEYVNRVDTIHDSIPIYTKIVIPSKIDTEYVEVVKYIERNLSKNDSLKIGNKILGWVTDYNTTKLYSHVFKNDSSAFIELNTIIYKNNLTDPKIVFKNRYPIYKTVIAPNKTEFYGGFGAYTNGLLLNASVLTKGRVMYQVQFDPINKFYGGQVLFKLFQIK